MKRVYIARNPIDAHLLKGILDCESIRAVVHGEFLWSTRGETPITPETCPSVWVIDDADYERAMEAVEYFESAEKISYSEGKEWNCHNCDEINEGQFTECWNCGTSRNEGQ